jgi:hypothetical protein
MLGDTEITGIGRAHLGSRPLPLRVDPVAHADEILRFQQRVVMGPLDRDCFVWAGAISDDGYGVYRITRDGVRHVVRTSRYALALSLKGNWLESDVFALHECDNPFLGGFSVLRRLCAVAHDTAHRNEQSGTMLRPKQRRDGRTWQDLWIGFFRCSRQC